MDILMPFDFSHDQPLFYRKMKLDWNCRLASNTFPFNVQVLFVMMHIDIILPNCYMNCSVLYCRGMYAIRYS